MDDKDFSYKRASTYGKAVDSDKGLDEIVSLFGSIEKLSNKLSENLSAERANEVSRQKTLIKNLTDISNGVRKLEDAYSKNGGRVDDKTVYDLFYRPLTEFKKDLQSSDLIINKKGESHNLDFTSKDSRNLMKEFIKFSSRVITKLDEFKNYDEAPYISAFNKQIQNLNMSLHKERKAYEKLKKETDLENAKREYLKNEAEKLQKKEDRKNKKAQQNSDEKSEPPKKINTRVDEQNLKDINTKDIKTTSYLVDVLGRAWSKEFVKLYTDETLSKIDDFNHGFQRFFKRILDEKDIENIQNETVRGALSTLKISEIITDLTGLTPEDSDLNSKNRYMSNEKGLYVILQRTLGEELELAKKIADIANPKNTTKGSSKKSSTKSDEETTQQSETKTGTVNPYGVPYKQRGLLRTLKKWDEKYANEEYEEKHTEEYRRERGIVVKEEPVKSKKGTNPSKKNNKNESTTDKSGTKTTSNKKSEKGTEKNGAKNRETIIGPFYESTKASAHAKMLQGTELSDSIKEFTNNFIESITSSIINSEKILEKNRKKSTTSPTTSTQSDTTLEDVILSLRSSIISLNANITRLRKNILDSSNIIKAVGKNIQKPTSAPKTPSQTTPGGTTPGGTTPGGTISGGTTPGGTISGGTTPGGTISGGTTPGGTSPIASSTTPSSSTPPYIPLIQGQTLSPYAQILRQQQQSQRQAQWNSILQSALKNLGVKPYSPPTPPTKRERFKSWASDKIDKGKSLVGRAINVGDTMAGGSLGEAIAGKSVLGKGLMNLSQKANKDGLKGAGKVIKAMGVAIGVIVLMLKKMVNSSPMLRAVVDLLSLSLTLFFLPIGTAIAKKLLPKVQNIVDTMIRWNKFYNNWPDSLIDGIVDAVKKLKGNLDKMAEDIKNLPKNVSNWFDETKEMGNGSTMQGLAKRVDNWVQRAKDRGDGSFWKGGLVQTEKDKENARKIGPLNPIKEIGRLFGFYAKGGYVPPRPGGTPIIVGEGGKGEYIVPEGSAIKAITSSGLGGGGETSITINVSGNIYGVNDLERTIKNAIDSSMNNSRYR